MSWGCQHIASFPPFGCHYNVEHLLNLKDTFGYCEGIFHSYMVQQTSNIQ